MVRGINSVHRRERKVYHKLEQIEHLLRQSIFGTAISSISVVLTLVLLIFTVKKIDEGVMVVLAIGFVASIAIISYYLACKYNLRCTHKKIELRDTLSLEKDRLNEFKSEKIMSEEILQYYKNKMKQGDLSETEKERKRQLECHVIPWFEEKIREIELKITTLENSIGEEYEK